MSLANLKIRPFKEVESDLAKIIGLYSKSRTVHKGTDFLCIIALRKSSQSHL